jgi:hypothetical protein
MKILISLALVVLSCGLCAAQTSTGGSAAPGVSVVENSWRRLWVRNPALDEDPLGILENQDRSERIRNEVIRQNSIRTALGKDPIPLPARNANNPVSARRRPYPYEYSYKVKITNTGAKKIRGLVWEYVLVDLSTGKEVGRHLFTSKVSVRPGKTRTMYGHSILPPASTVDARNVGEKSEGHYSESVVIKSIYYDDNTAWQRAFE